MRPLARLLVLFVPLVVLGCPLAVDDPYVIKTGDSGASDGGAGTGGASAACKNGTLDANESDVDCGGPCPRCATDKSCSTPKDCQSGVCESGKCRAPDCGDGVENANETDIDCGGGTCDDCGSGKKCKANSDCTSNDCSGGVCQSP